MRYLFMDNQLNNQKSIKQTSSSTTTESPITPILETPNNSVSETPIPTAPEIPVPETELPSAQTQPEVEERIPEPPTPETELPPLQTQPEIEETAPSDEYKNEYQDVLDQYATNTNKETPTVLENETQAPTLTDFDITPRPPQNNIFKIIFIFSLIVFVSTATILAFVYFKNQNSSPAINGQSSMTNDSTPTISSDTCFLNDKTYQAGEKFTATDGCNTCTCVSQNNISCTDKECLSSKSATESATNSTKTASSSNNSNLKGLSPKQTFLILKKEEDSLKTSDDYLAFTYKYGDTNSVSTIKSQISQIKLLPSGFVDQIISMINANPKSTDITNINEQINGNSATLTVLTNNINQKGTITMKLEDGIWKLNEENWETNN